MAKREKTLQKIKDLISKKETKSNKSAKKLAMKNNIKLGKLRREFCQRCYVSLEKAKRRVKRDYLSIECLGCGKKTRYKILNS
jgi:RNase P subunit RPR2